MICLALFLSCALQLCRAVPIPRDTQYLSWQSEPNVRGTWTILQTCVITMVLCVYNAIHMNVPGAGDSLTQRSLRRASWVLMGLLAPELVVYAAWCQWAEAKALTTEIKSLHDTKSYSTPSLANWTFVHSFFVVMGGFAVEKKNSKVMQELSDLDRVTLTARSILYLAEHSPEMLAPITEKSIQDRSKADITAKVLVCIQAGYLIIQVCGRLANRLPVTMLEVNTIGHVICAIAMLVFWLKKPLNVMEPMILVLNGDHHLMARWLVDAHTCDYFEQASSVRRNRGFRKKSDKERHTANTLLSKLSMLSNNTETQSFGQSSRLAQIEGRESDSTEMDSFMSQADTNLARGGPSSINQKIPIVLGYPGDDLDDVESMRLSGHAFLILDSKDSSSSISDIQAKINSSPLWPRTITKIYFVSSDKCKKKTPKSFKLGHSSDASTLIIQLTTTGFARWITAFDKDSSALRDGISWARARSKDWNGGSEDPNAKYTFISLTLFTAAYGGLHATCWHSHFPSIAESFLWRISSLVIAGSGFAFSASITIDEYYPPIFKFFSDIIDTAEKIVDQCLAWLRIGFISGDDIIGMSLGILFLVACTCYVLARVFLVIEAFISLRSLPSGAFETPSWTPWLPHL